MTTPNVHCLSHLPTAHEDQWPSAEVAVSDASGRPDHRPAPIRVWPLSASLPRPATCVIPMLP